MRAFVLIELLIVLVLVMLTAAWVTPIVTSWQPEVQVRKVATVLVSDLRLAAMDSRAGRQNDTYGIKFDSGSYLVYKGASYLTRDLTADRVIELPANVQWQLDLSDGAQEIAFNRSGEPRQIGKVVISHGFGKQAAVVINQWASFVE